MTQQELYQALKSLGLPVTYSHWVEGDPNNPPPPPPYLAYRYAYSSDIMADNQNYVGRGNWQVELYSENKDLANEAKIEALFKSLRLPFTKVETWLASEGLRQVIYEVQLIGG